MGTWIAILTLLWDDDEEILSDCHSIFLLLTTFGAYTKKVLATIYYYVQHVPRERN